MEAFPLLGGLHLHLQQVILAKFTLQVLDGTDTSGGRHRKGERDGAHDVLRLDLLLGLSPGVTVRPGYSGSSSAEHCAAGGRGWVWTGTHLSFPDTMMATRSHTASASAM